MVNFLKYIVPTFFAVYGLAGLIIAGKEGDLYSISSCSHSLSNYVTGSSILYLIGGLCSIGAMAYADKYERILDISDILNEHYYMNFVILCGTVFFIVWGSFALGLSRCVVDWKLFNVGVGIIIMQVCTGLVQVLYFRYVIIKSIKEIFTCNVKWTNPFSRSNEKNTSASNATNYFASTTV